MLKLGTVKLEKYNLELIIVKYAHLENIQILLEKKHVAYAQNMLIVLEEI